MGSDKKGGIVLIGGGGHCRACIDVIENGRQFSIIGIVDNDENVGRELNGYEVLASDKDLRQLISKHRQFHIAIGQIDAPDKRVTMYRILKELGAEFPVIISSSAYVSEGSRVGEGTIVMNRAVVGAKASVGDNCIVNTGAIIEHDSTVGSFCHISTGGIVNGGCRIGDRVFLGSGGVISHSVSICSDVVLGAGCAVVKSIDRPGTYVGVPATRLT